MTWRLAKSLIQLRAQVNAEYPNRDKASDGTIGDAAHAARKSDHDPNKAGVVTAEDFDENLTSPTSDAFNLVHALQASRDERVKYIIYERQITVQGDITQWKPYHGINPHEHHFHISVSSDPKLYDDERPWNITASLPPMPVNLRTLTRGMRGGEIGILQNKLIALGFPVKVDNDFGPATERAVRAFQTIKGIEPDGKVGMMTRALLGMT